MMKAFLAAASASEGTGRDKARAVSRSVTERLHYSASLVLSVTEMNPTGWMQKHYVITVSNTSRGLPE